MHDTVAGIVDRFRKTIPQTELIAMDAAKAKSLLTEKELNTLGTEHVTFRVNVPVKVIIIRDAAMGDKPFWLKKRDFKPMGFKITIQGTEVDFWMKDFEAGRIGLGVNSLTGGNAHYIVALMPLKTQPKLEVTELYPGQLRIGTLKDGLQPFVDRPEAMPKLPLLPGVLSGLTVIRTQYESRDDAKLINLFHNTNHPARPKPDQIILTWSGDPQTTQTIQWRTGTGVAKGQVQWVKKSAYNRFQPARPKRAKATTFRMEDANLLNDPVIHRHTATLTGLEPDTTYLYSVGDGSGDGWSEMAEFTTAPGRTEPFSFVYMGDAQNGLERWGSLVHNAFRQRPDAAFYIMAGDLVNRGNERDDWDSFFHSARGIYDRRPVVPAIGNHENQGGHPGMYLQMFDLPKNGPESIEPERAYTLRYSNAEFFVLDSNLTPESQSAWLENALKSSTATWKFAVYHHPAYSSKPERDNPGIRDQWTPLFDKYHRHGPAGSRPRLPAHLPDEWSKEGGHCRRRHRVHRVRRRDKILRARQTRLHRVWHDQYLHLPGARHPDQRQPPRLPRLRHRRQTPRQSHYREVAKRLAPLGQAEQPTAVHPNAKTAAKPAWFHTHRIAGGDRHHRDPSRHVAACLGQGQKQGHRRQVFQ